MRILVFDEGRMCETGSFDELVARNGRFATVARAQFMASAEDVDAKDVEAKHERQETL